MSNADTVKRFARAFFEKDTKKIMGLVEEYYTSKGPMLEMNSHDELIGFAE